MLVNRLTELVSRSGNRELEGSDESDEEDGILEDAEDCVSPLLSAKFCLVLLLVTAVISLLALLRVRSFPLLAV